MAGVTFLDIILSAPFPSHQHSLESFPYCREIILAYYNSKAEREEESPESQGSNFPIVIFVSCWLEISSFKSLVIIILLKSSI